MIFFIGLINLGSIFNPTKLTKHLFNFEKHDKTFSFFFFLFSKKQAFENRRQKWLPNMFFFFFFFIQILPWYFFLMSIKIIYYYFSSQVNFKCAGCAICLTCRRFLSLWQFL